MNSDSNSRKKGLLARRFSYTPSYYVIRKQRESRLLRSKATIIPLDTRKVERIARGAENLRFALATAIDKQNTGSDTEMGELT